MKEAHVDRKSAVDTPAPPRTRRRGGDAELNALRRIVATLDNLSPEAADRILRYLNSRMEPGAE